MLRRHRVLVCAAGAAVALGAGLLAVPGGASAWAAAADHRAAQAGATQAGATQAGAVRTASSWSRPMQLPGLTALNKGGDTEIDLMSCPSAGNCSVGGFLDINAGAFVASERHGRWGKAIGVPGLAALSKAGEIHLLSLSCGSPGDCAAGGYYFSSDHPDGFEHSFVAVQRNGRWGKAIQMPGLVALSHGQDAEVDSLSCSAPDSCAAGGIVDGQGYVAVERNGRWGKAIQIPGLAALEKGGGGAEVNDVSCGSAGNCVVGGDYGSFKLALTQGFVASEQNGRWAKAIAVPGLAALNKGKEATVNGVSCVSAGNCSVGGEYEADHGGEQGFVASERNGRWGKAIAVPGLAVLNTDKEAEVDEVSCASAGNCAAEGNYSADHVQQVFVTSERNGRWGKAIAVPGLAALNKRENAEVNELSCAPAGTCVAGGDYYDRSDHDQGFVASARNGLWGRAIAVPGLAALNTGRDAAVLSVSCSPGGTCTAGGYYSNRSDKGIGFIITRTR